MTANQVASAAQIPNLIFVQKPRTRDAVGGHEKETLGAELFEKFRRLKRADTAVVEGQQDTPLRESGNDLHVPAKLV
jgi:hypothetical protein